MTETAVPRMSRGVRFRRDPDGSAMLLVPEGIVRLNDSAAATLELVDGTRTLTAIVDALCVRYAVPREEASRDVDDLIERLSRRGYVDP
jgi:pyrroloquinoline quinone biosynthesis protein D